MNNDSADTSPVKVVEPETTSVFICFHYKGFDNGMEKSGFDSRVVKIPSSVQLATAEDLKEVSNAIAASEFQGERRYVGLEITIFNIIRLPV